MKALDTVFRKVTAFIINFLPSGVSTKGRQPNEWSNWSIFKKKHWIVLKWYSFASATSVENFSSLILIPSFFRNSLGISCAFGSLVDSFFNLHLLHLSRNSLNIYNLYLGKKIRFFVHCSLILFIPLLFFVEAIVRKENIQFRSCSFLPFLYFAHGVPISCLQKLWCLEWQICVGCHRGEEARGCWFFFRCRLYFLMIFLKLVNALIVFNI